VRKPKPSKGGSQPKPAAPSILDHLKELRRIPTGDDDGSGRKILTAAEFRARDSASKNIVNATRRVVQILPVEDLVRRTRLEADTAAWLMWYFSNTFWHPFTEVGIKMVNAIEGTIIHGNDQCIAGPRGEGKSSLAERVVIKAILTGQLNFGLIFGANSNKAMERLQNIKAELEENDRLLADYPEVCAPIHALEGLHNRVGGQTVSGKISWNPEKMGQEFHGVRSKMQWAGELIRLPTVPGSRASGSWIGCYGLDTPVRGTNLRGLRPVHALIDDADTEETTNNSEQADKLEKRIDQAIAGLAPQGKRIGRVMLCTIPSRISVAWKYSDPQFKPSWNGKRYKLIEKWPDDPGLAEEYINLRLDDQRNGDTFGRKAHAYYVSNQAAIEKGSVVTNPFRFVASVLSDGSQMEVSTLEFCYNEIARTSIEAFSSEYQSEVIEEKIDEEAFITSAHIQKRVSGLAKYLIPDGCTLLTQGIDPGQRRHNCVVRAWKPDGTAYIIDYATVNTFIMDDSTSKAVDEAIARSLRERKDFLDAHPYKTLDGKSMDVDLTLIDAHWRQDAVVKFCREAGPRWMAGVGLGSTGSCVGKTYTHPIRGTVDKRPGNHWYNSRRSRGVWVICLDSNYWILWEHDHWMRDRAASGGLWLFGIGPNEEEQRRGKLSFDQYNHKTYAMHITAQRQVAELKAGKVVFVWRELRHEDHFLDASKLADVAADMSGLNLTGAARAEGQKKRRQTMAELAASAAR
jgi:hypothetical protein